VLFVSSLLSVCSFVVKTGKPRFCFHLVFVLLHLFPPFSLSPPLPPAFLCVFSLSRFSVLFVLLAFPSSSLCLFSFSFFRSFFNFLSHFPSKSFPCLSLSLHTHTPSLSLSLSCLSFLIDHALSLTLSSFSAITTHTHTHILSLCLSCLFFPYRSCSLSLSLSSFSFLAHVEELRKQKTGVIGTEQEGERRKVLQHAATEVVASLSSVRLFHFLFFFVFFSFFFSTSFSFCSFWSL